MIERLLAADAAIERGDLDAAEKLFGQVAEADPRNAIAAVGLGRVAAGRDDATGARTWFLRALEIDPDEAAARRLLTALERELATLASSPAPAVAPVTAPSQPRAPRRRSLLERVRAWLRLSGRG
jgi:tetratricopeptide (TPR) repeat protein